MFGMELFTITGMLAFGGTAVAIGVLTGLIMLVIIKVLQEKYHMFV